MLQYPLMSLENRRQFKEIQRIIKNNGEMSVVLYDSKNPDGRLFSPSGYKKDDFLVLRSEFKNANRMVVSTVDRTLLIVNKRKNK